MQNIALEDVVLKMKESENITCEDRIENEDVKEPLEPSIMKEAITKENIKKEAIEVAIEAKINVNEKDNFANKSKKNRKIF